jgi:hypothetical protein
MHRMDFDPRLTLNTELLDAWHHVVVKESLELLSRFPNINYTNPLVGNRRDVKLPSFGDITSQVQINEVSSCVVLFFSYASLLHDHQHRHSSLRLLLKLVCLVVPLRILRILCLLSSSGGTAHMPI